MKRKEWTLLAISAARSEGLSPVQLQKSLFILSEKLPDKEKPRYRFVPYHYGPFCEQIYTDASELASERLIEIRLLPWERYRQYVVTGEGQDRAKQLEGRLSSNARDYLHSLLCWIRQFDFQTLVNIIYEHFPQYSVNSVLRKER